MNKKKKLKDVNEDLSKSLNEDSSYSLQLNKLRQEISQNIEELAKQRSRQIGIQERSLGDLAVRKIVELRNTIKGIYGTVSSLGEIESKYSLALEVAAGHRINSIVVDTDAVAQKCIEHLKNNKLGVATFLPLNKIKSRIIESNVKEILNQKGVHGLAVELVSHEPRYKDVFSYVLGSTVIVDNLETARKIGVGRARMVTLEGDLVEPSGAMVGGYRVQKTGFGFKEREINENVDNLEEQLNKQKTLFSHVENKKISGEELIRNLREERANIEAEILKIEKALNLEEDTSNLINGKKELLDEQKKLEKELMIIESSIKHETKELEDTKSKKQILKDKLADPSLSKNLEKLEDKRLKIKEKLLEIQGNIKNIDTQIVSMLLPEKEKTEKIIKQQDKEYDDFVRELENVKELIKKREQELKSKEQEERKFLSNFKDIVTKRNKLTEKIQNSETDIAREEEKLKGSEQKLNNINIDRAKAVAEKEALEKEFEPFKDAKIKRGLNLEELKIKIRDDEKTLNSIGNVNLRALEVYEQVETEFNKLLEKKDSLYKEKTDVLTLMNEIETKKKEHFMKTFEQANKNFTRIFSTLFSKGNAYLQLDNKEKPFEEGLSIKVKLTGNRYMDIKSLSGGEKTITALSFIFAIQEYQPASFYILDEIDAALDKHNAERLSKLIREYSNKAQYVVISHNDALISEADTLFGISMKDGVSKVTSLNI